MFLSTGGDQSVSGIIITELHIKRDLKRGLFLITDTFVYASAFFFLEV